MIRILSNVLFLIGFSFIILFFYSLFKYRNRVSGLFSLMFLSIAIYVIGYGFELNSISIEQIKFFLKLEYFGLSFITTLWLILCYKFYFNNKPSLNFKIAVMIVPVLTLFFNVTNEYHHLFYRDISVVEHDGFFIAHLSKGPLYFVYVVYSYLILLIGAIIFYKVWKKSVHTMKIKYFMMFIGSIFPVIIDIFYILGLSPYGLDLLPFGLSILAILCFIALFRYDLLDMVEVIRSVAFTETSDGIIVVDDKSRLIDFNKAAQKIFGFLNVINIGMDLSTNEEIREIIGYKTNLFEIEKVQDAYYRYYEVSVKDLVEKKKKVGSIFFIRDITNQKKMVENLEIMASYDDLTQVYNRRRLIEEAKREVLRVRRHNTSISILMIDIDFFKTINDRYGHLVGDEVIKAVIKICKKRIRSTDIIGRYGGEEFIIILPDANLKDSFRVAEHIRKNVEDMEVEFGDIMINATISIGVVSAENNDEDIDVMEMINSADLELYNAKNTGKNRISAKAL